MLTVALTGGIACGKSVVARILETKGCRLHSADREAHALMEPGTAAWEAIAARFGPEILRPDRTIDRKRLGRIVFADPEARAFLNSLLHPRVLERIRELVAALEGERRTLIFVSEAALTVEAGFAPFFDKVVVVDCPEDVQARRLAERDGLSEEEARRRIGAQMPSAEKRGYADYVIDASGTLAQTVEETEAVYARLVQDAELKAAGKRNPRRSRPDKRG